MFNISEVDKGNSDLARLVSELDAFQSGNPPEKPVCS